MRGDICPSPEGFEELNTPCSSVMNRFLIWLALPGIKVEDKRFLL